MAAALKALFDKRRMALTQARLRAWWNGETFDAEAALQSIAQDAANDTSGADDELFDAPEPDAPARLVALAKLWGQGRIRPGDETAEKLEPARMGLSPDGVLAVLSPGLAAPLVALAEAHPGRIDAFEWREEALELLSHGVAKAKLAGRVSVTRIDLEAHVWPAAAYDGCLSIDDFAYVGFPPHLAHQLIKCLKPGACAIVECYVGLPSRELATAFASSFAEPQIRAHGDVLKALTDVGFVLEADEDMTEDFLGLARQGFKQLGAVLSEAGVDVAAARELAWEAEAWRTRMKLLGQRRLERRRFTLRRPSDAAPLELTEAAQPASA